MKQAKPTPPDSSYPRHDLAGFRAEFAAASKPLPMTAQAMLDAFALGIQSHEAVVAIIQTMRPEHFYKSMPSEGNALEFQDVYHVPWAGGTLYVKFKSRPLGGFRLLSFKAR